MKRRTIELRSGTWEWSMVDPDDPRRRSRLASRARTATAGPRATGAQAQPGEAAEPPHTGAHDGDPSGAPPLPRRRIELRSTSNDHHRMCVRVPPHLGHAGDEAAVTMLAQSPDRRTVVDHDGSTWALWPEHHENGAGAHSLTGPRRVRAKRDGDRTRVLALPDGLALGQLTDREILDLLV